MLTNDAINGPLSQLARCALQEVVIRKRQTDHVCSGMHGKQALFACDQARRLAALCGRRSGKSHGLAGKYILTAIQNPGELSVFIGISAARANDILGRGLRVLSKSLDLQTYGMAPKAMTKGGQFVFEFPNGHRIWVAGCKNQADAEKFRGDPYCLAGVDEADSMRGHLEYLCQEVLEPTLVDFDGQLVLTGTPGATPVGYFHDITTGENRLVKKWVTHSWTVLDNTFLPNAAAWLKQRCEELGLDETSPAYLREWLGLWVVDKGALVYEFSRDVNAFFEYYDTTDANIVIGVDFGVNDATAFAVVAYRHGLPDINILESKSYADLGPSAAYVKLQEYRQRYPNCRVVGDTGGIGKAYVKEWSDRFNFYVEPASKLDVRGQVNFMNGLLRSGVLKVHSSACRKLIGDWQILPWNEDRTAHDDAYDDHEPDAARYAVIACHPSYAGEHEPPAAGTPEAEQLATKERLMKALERARKKKGMKSCILQPNGNPYLLAA